MTLRIGRVEKGLMRLQPQNGEGWPGRSSSFQDLAGVEAGGGGSC